MESPFGFVARDLFFLIRTHSPTVRLTIRRLTNHNMMALRLGDRLDHPNVSLNDFHSLVQSIKSHISASSIRHSCLALDSRYCLSWFQLGPMSRTPSVH